MPKIDLDTIEQTNRTGYPAALCGGDDGPLVPPARARRAG